MSRIKSAEIVATLKKIAPSLFKATNGLAVKTDWNPDEAVNTEGVYVTRPDSNLALQVATVDFSTTVYDEELVFDILLVTTSTNPYFDEARDTIESLVSDSDYDCFYSRTYVADETNNNNNITVEYTFTFNRTICK